MRTPGKRTVLLLILLAVIIGLRMSGAGDYLTFENLQKNRDALLASVQEHRVRAVLLYGAVYIAVTAFSIPGATVLTLAGGFLFGTLPAVLCVNLAATAGAVLAFLSARYLLGSRLQAAYPQQLARFNAEMEKNGVRYLLTLRLLPVFPFFLVNFLSGLTRVPVTAFVWTTSLGIIPGSLVFAYAGHQLESVHAVGDILTAKVLLSFGALALFTLVPAIADRFRKNASEKNLD
jgi:uncharacterized membrane protein YdjX (TVP38/TMEM64 family)